MADITNAQREEEERIAHAGGFARIARACAHHPGRVIISCIVATVLIVGLAAAFKGTLVNDFNIPGSDAQKAVDLLNSKFGGQRGAALRVVLAAPEGERLDTPERLAAMQKMLGVAATAQKQLDTKASDASATTNPL